MTWKDPAAALAVLIWIGILVLVATGRAVPPEVWVTGSVIAGYFYAAHQGTTSSLAASAATQAGAAQVITALNGGAPAALTHTPTAAAIDALTTPTPVPYAPPLPPPAAGS